MDQGDRAPRPESAASTAGRSAAIDAAFAAFPEFSSDDVPSAGGGHVVDEPVHDDALDKPAVSSADAPDQSPEVETPDPSRPAEDQPSPPTSKDALEAPKHWPKDRRDQFATLPEDAKRIVLERNKEANVAVTKSQQEAAQYRRTAEAVGSLFNDDHRQQMQSADMDDIGAVRYLIQQHDALNRDPVGFLKSVVQRIGIKPEQLFGQTPGASPATTGDFRDAKALTPSATAEQEEWRDPDLIELREKLAKLEAVETNRQRQAADHQRGEQQRFNTWFTQQCDAFENAIDDDGNPKYPHLPAVINDVIRLVSDPATRSVLHSEPHKALEQAYTQALYLNPEIRQQLIDADFNKRMSERDAQNAVKKAQTAATRKGSPWASGQAGVGRMSREDAINKAMRDAGL